MQMQCGSHADRRWVLSGRVKQSAVRAGACLVVALISAACAQEAQTPTPAPAPAPVPSCAAPTMQPTPGTFPPVTLSVVLQTTTPSAAIHYTLDGSTPSTGSALYERPIPLSSTATLKAIATGPNMQDSPVSSGLYEFVRQRVTMTGRVLYDRDAVSARTSDPVALWSRDETSGKGIDEAITYYDASTGRYTMTNLPSHPIGVEASVNWIGEQPLSDCYFSWTELDLTSADPSHTETIDLHVGRLFHLTAPVDNAAALPDEVAEYASPIRFQWEAIPEAARYSVDICRDYVKICTGVFHNDDLRDTGLQVDLPPLASPDRYQLHLDAYNGTGDLVGSLLVRTPTSLAYAYPFRVK